MAAIDQKLIDRINVLAKKKKEGTITPEELNRINWEKNILSFLEKDLNLN